MLIALIGSVSLAEFAEVKEKIVRQRFESGITRVLVDASRREDSLGLMDLLEVGKELADTSMTGMRLAVFSDPPQPGIEFARQVTSKLQGAKMRTFTSEQSARDWLYSPDSTSAV